MLFRFKDFSWHKSYRVVKIFKLFTRRIIMAKDSFILLLKIHLCPLFYVQLGLLRNAFLWLWIRWFIKRLISSSCCWRGSSPYNWDTLIICFSSFKIWLIYSSQLFKDIKIDLDKSLVKPQVRESWKHLNSLRISSCPRDWSKIKNNLYVSISQFFI